MYLEKMLNNPKEVSNWNFVKKDIGGFHQNIYAGEDNPIVFDNPANYKMILCYENSKLIDNAVVGSRYQHVDYNEVYPMVHNSLISANFKPINFIRTGRKYRHIYVSNEMIHLNNEEYYLTISFDYNIQQKLSLSAFLFRKVCSNGLYMPTSALSHLKVGHKRIEDKENFFVQLPNFNVITQNANLLLNRLDNAHVSTRVKKVQVERQSKGVKFVEEVEKGSLIVNGMDFCKFASNKDSVEMVRNTYPGYRKNMTDGFAALNTLTYWASHYGKHADASRFNRIESTGEVVKYFLN